MSELATAAPHSAERGRPAAKGEYRPDIQGLRAIAVALVVVYHLYPRLVPGGFAGVDVFFVISGYLITGHLWRGFRDTGKVSLVDFWGRRAKRLVPAAALVLTVTWIGMRLLGPVIQFPDTARQVMASALYYQNWQLAGDAVDYLKSTNSPSPVQHFWSLSVEEQFYLVWPLLFLFAALVTWRAARARRVVAGCLTIALVVASLAWSVHETSVDPSAAYFVTTTRMWELGIGGLLALAPAGLTRLLARQGWLAWLGLAAVIASAFVLSGTTRFPGWIALLPVLGSAAMIAGGSTEGRLGPAWLTSLRPMVFLGGISYSLYLWHWPVINLYSDWRGKAPGAVAGPVLVAVSVLLAWLTKVGVEDRVRLARVLKGRRWLSVSTALAAALPVTVVAVFLSSLPKPYLGPLPPGYPGAAVLAGTVKDVPVEPLLPHPQALTLPGYWKQGCLETQHAVVNKWCVFDNTGHTRLTVALVGDSTAGNWWEPLNIIAQQEHWKLVTELHANCPWTATMMEDPDFGTTYPSCYTWGKEVLTALITKIDPDIVITTGHQTMVSWAHSSSGPQGREDIGAGEAAYWTQLEKHGIHVIAMSETPELPFGHEPNCVLQYAQDTHRCDVSRSGALWPDEATSFAAREAKGTVPVVDMNDLICTPTVCPAILGNLLVFQDEHHFSPLFAQSLAPFLKTRLLATGMFR